MARGTLARFGLGSLHQELRNHLLQLLLQPFHMGQLIALCLLAFAFSFVPSRLTQPTRKNPATCASNRICTNKSSNAPRKCAGRIDAIVS